MLLNVVIKFLAVVVCTLASAIAFADHYVDRSFTTHDKQELIYQHFAPAKGTKKNPQSDTLIIWVASGFGVNARHYDVAEKLVHKGIEVWLIDFAESLFLPPGTKTMREMDARYVRDMITVAHKKTGKKIILLSQSYGAIPTLKGIREWQLAATEQKIKTNVILGAILFSPDLYATIPALGQAPIYDPAVSATNVPVMIFQGEKRNTRWQVNYVVDALQQGGSQVYLKIQKGVTAVFYQGDDSPATKVRLQVIQDDIIDVIQLFKRTPAPVTAAPLIQQHVTASALDNKIRTFKGHPLPPKIDLFDVKGKHYLRENYQGKVTVVNFWATWCPPCVKEIPSLNRLRMKMQGKPFELISVNYAESKQTIRDFLKKVNVDFPVLLDESGEVSAKWNVLVYPSTFVIGADGRIHYGVNAAIEWDSDEVIQKLHALGN